MFKEVWETGSTTELTQIREGQTVGSSLLGQATSLSRPCLAGRTTGEQRYIRCHQSNHC